MRTFVQIDNTARFEIVVYDTFDQPVTGLVNGDFTKYLSKDGATSAVAVTVTEIANGRYSVTFTPNAVGVWSCVVLHATHNPRGWQEEFDVLNDFNTYQAKVLLFDDDSGASDRYVVVFYKNSQPITSGITSPTMQVIKVSDGTDLIASTALTQIASLGLYKHDQSANRISSGASYIAKIQATIDSSTRTWFQPVGRDSTA